MEKSNLINVTGLWTNKTKSGTTFLSGKIGPNLQMLVFKNDKKTADNHPDFRVCFAPVEHREKSKPESEETSPF